MYRILPVLTEEEIAECRRIAASAEFVDGRLSNPHNIAKQNQQLHEPQAYQASSKLLHAALSRSPEFRDFAFPVAMLGIHRAGAAHDQVQRLAGNRR